MTLFLVIYGVVIAAFSVGLAYRPNYFGNIGFLVVGLLAGIYPAFIIEEIRRAREASNVATALFQELAKAVGRCCFDYEAPWRTYLHRQENMPVDRLRKFIPEPPVIYPALAPRIALLRNDEAQAVIDFYMALAAWRRDAENYADDFQERRQDLVHGPVRLLAYRLKLTLRPGQRALEALSRHVPGADEIERSAMRDADELIPKEHPHAGKTVRERIALVLAEEPPAPAKAAEP